MKFLKWTWLCVLACYMNLPALAQDYPSVQAVQGDLISPTAAMSELQGTSGFTYASGAEIYHPHTDSRFIELANSLGYDSVSWSALNSADLAIAKSNYVDASYLYVRNGVEFTPLYGLQHGAMGAVYQGSGTAFDQTHLLVELMHVAGIPAHYQIGTFSPTATEFESWFGTNVPKTACEILANGGIPALVNSENNCDNISGYASDSGLNVTLSHIWAKIEVNGTAYLFDPSFKTYEIYENKMYGAEYDLLAKSGVTAGGVFSAISGTVSGTDYSGPDPKALRDYLDQHSGTLLFSLQNGNENVSMLEVLGGRRLVVDHNAPHLTELGNRSASVGSNLLQIPKELTAYITIDLDLGNISPSYSGNVNIPLSQIGTDIVVLSPIEVTSGGHYSDGSSVFTSDDSRFELSILRPGSMDHAIIGNTGVTTGEAASFAPINETSGDNLLEIVASLADVTNKDWRIEMQYNAPFAANAGTYGDRLSIKTADTFTATTLIIQAGVNESFSGELYEKFIPKKTNLWYGLYIDDSQQVSQCGDQVRANLDSILRGGAGATGSYYALAPTGNLTCGPNIMPPCFGFHCPVPGTIDQQLGCTWQKQYRSVWVPGTSSPPDYQPISSFDACFATPESDIIKVTSHDKRLRLKSMISAQWSLTASDEILFYGRVGGGQSSHMISLGVVSASINHSYDLSFSNDALLIDVDTKFSFASAQNSKSLAAIAVASAAGLSASEGLILQNVTGAPRVDSAVTKNDWYAWNANYNDITGVHSGPYARDYDPAVSSPNGTATFEGYLPSQTQEEIETKAGYENSYMVGLTAEGYTHIAPARSDLGPVETYEQNGPTVDITDDPNYVYQGRYGRKGTTTTYIIEDKHVLIAHIVGVGKKGGTGVTLPEFEPGELDAEELTKGSYDKIFGKFAVDDQNGNFSFTLENELTIGGSASNQLTFSRTYESGNTNSGPLGQGWTHNHDAKIVVSTDLKTAFDGKSPQQSIPALIAAMATMELAENTLSSGDWTVLPKSLLIYAWMAENIHDNQVIVTASTGSDTFYRAHGNNYTNVDNPTAVLSQTGRAKFYEAMKPYIPEDTKDDLLLLSNEQKEHSSLYPRRFWVSYEQYLDYSDVEFTYTTSDKTLISFPRGKPLLTDSAPISCFVDVVRPYIGAHDPAYCGKEAGSWNIANSIDVTGREIVYTYGSGIPDLPAAASFLVPVTGDRLESVEDMRYGYKLNFEYEGHSGGLRLKPLNFNGLDNPDDPVWVASENSFVPDSALTHGQLLRLKSVTTNVPSGPSLTFSYDTTIGRHSPLLSSFTNTLGNTHNLSYTTIAADGNNERNALNLLTSFTPASLTVPVFDISYSPQGHVMSLTDSESRKSLYGINGIRNVVADPLGNETISHYDPQGRLIIQISPPYEDEE